MKLVVSLSINLLVIGICYADQKMSARRNSNDKLQRARAQGKCRQ